MTDHSIPIREALAAAAKPLVMNAEAPDSVQTQAAVATTQTDLLSSLREHGALLVAVESVADAMATAATSLRAALLEAMVEAGAPGIETEHHRIGWADGAPGVHITGDVPTEYLRVPAPAPDKALIAKSLRAGRPVEGAVLMNGSPYLSIRAKKV